MESSEFLEDIVAGDGSQYMVPGANPLTLEELVECYKTSDHYKDIMRIVTGDHAKHTYWWKVNLGLGCPLIRHPIVRSINSQEKRQVNKSFHEISISCQSKL